MPGKDKKYAVEGMRVKCSIGTTMCMLNTMGHGVIYQGKSVLNANDHIPMVNITTFGTCINKPCVPVTPLAWRFCNEEHMVDGAPALTTDSLCNCALGGVISIVDNSVSMGGIGAQSAKSGYAHNDEDARSNLKSSTEIVDNDGKVETTPSLKTTTVLGVTIIGSVSEEYKEIINNRYEKADQLARKVFDKFKNELCIRNAEYPLDKTPHYKSLETVDHKRGVYYNANSDIKNPRGNGTTFFHELGHMIDHASTGFQGNASCTAEFKEALISDGQGVLALFKSLSKEEQQKFLKQICNKNAHSFSDLIDAITEGELHGAYGHSEKYWKGEGKLQAEAFAHFFEASMGAEEKRDFLQNFFPTAFEKFNSMLENMIESQE